MGAPQQFDEPVLAEPTSDRREPDDWGWTRRQRAALGVLAALLVAVLTVILYQRPHLLSDGVVVLHGQPVTVPSRIDPNVATLEELARIPHIGEKVAAKLVAYRDARKGLTPDGVLFRTPDDLARIPGLGKKTAQELAAYFEFPDEAERQPEDGGQE